ncbi:MAG: secretin N-terminal domain-containing protein, partial [Alphaproteobacteria bacterium]|nr:secretin N-terminal domain-containing protein [Alphaproteobacteria bacterium]
DVPLKDVLIELGRLADVDIEIDPNIQGGIVFRAQNRPFSEVIERISTLAGLRYNMKNNVLRVERDNAVVRTYALDFLGFDRASTSDVNITTSVLSAGAGGGGGGGLNSGSSAAITYATEATFWQSLENTIQSIVDFQPTTGLSDSTSTDGSGQSGQNFFVVNRQAGTLTVSLPERQQLLVENYLEKLQESVSSQVLIEAKIIEVTLNDQYQSGVNWNQVFSSSPLALDVDYNDVPTVGGVTQLLIGGSDVADPSLDAIVSLTQQFGTTRTLSSPRLHAMNNQQAVLTFARNFVYFDISIEREQQIAGDTVLPPITTIDAEPVTIPVGIIISLQPSINMKTKEVTLSVRPTLSRVIDTVADPAVASQLQGTNDNITNLIPVIEVRELDSLMRMRSGQVMVLGGLMEQIGENSDRGVPFVSGIPWVGNAFKAALRSEQTRELFILVKATIVGSDGTADNVDKRLYRKFTTDHRPLAF